MVAAAPRGARLLARFLLSGVLLFAGKRLLWPAEAARRPLVVEVTADASDHDVREAVETAMLLDVAERAGFAHSDAVVRERVLHGLGLVEDVSGNPNRAVERGIALGLHHNDPVARGRLLADARSELAKAPSSAAVTDGEARAEISAHPAKYLEPTRVRFRQVFLARQKRGPSLERDASAVLERLRASPAPDTQQLAALSDPWPWTDASTSYATSRLDAIYGAGFGEAVAAAPVGSFSDAIRSSFGVHFVCVDERVGERVADFASVAARAKAAIAEERKQALFEARVRELSQRYDVVLVHKP